MTRIQKNSLSIAVASLFFSCSLSAQAAQLGKLTVLSSENQPFRAEIQIDAVQAGERATLKAGLAPEDAFKAARLQLDPKLKDLTFAVVDGPKPNTVIVKVSSEKPFPAGFTDALVQLVWAGGKVSREYTLDVPTGQSKPGPSLPDIRPPMTLPAPTGQAKPAPAPAVAPPAEAADKPQTPEKPQAKEESKAASELARADAMASTERVRKGQTLWGIASKLAGNGVTVNQAMAAVYEANQDAFIGGSVHLIREGAQIRIPERSAIVSRSGNEALLVLAQHDDRNVYSSYAKQLGLLKVSPQKGGSESGQVTQGKLESNPDSAASATAEVDRLKISPGAAQVGAGEAKADASAEELIAKTKALQEANERIALLEKNVNDLQKLLELQKDQAAPAIAPDSKATEEAAAPQSSPAATAPAEQAKAPEVEAKPAEKTPPVEADKLEKAQKLAETKPVPWYSSLWFLGSMGGFGVVLLGALLLLLKKKRESGLAQDLEEVDEPSSERFDEALAWASAPAQQTEEPTEAPAKSVNAVESEEFDLDEVLSEQTPTPTPTPTPAPTEPVAVEQSASIPDLGQASEDAGQQSGSLNNDVELDFPEEESKAPESSILDDLDSLEKGAAAAQSELDELRKNAPVEAESSAENDPDIEEESEVVLVSDAEVSSDAFDKAVENIDLDIDVPKPPVDEATWQEVATKLDLAGAYVEIGDADGAKELLNEVIQRGDAEQVQKAKSLLAGL
ncbi:MAG TPA: FimV/HubP family polar landmark protein [Limnobacter sp.]|nr:FimV/HubP family polar landmark protein [Limnobacter sp.]